MSTEVLTSARGFGWLSRLRERGAFAGMGYALVVTLGLMTGWFLSAVIGETFEHSFTAALRNAVVFFGIMAVHQLPTLPLLAAGVNLAPSAGLRRYLWLAGTVLTVWGFCTLCFSVEEREFVPNLQYAVMVTLIVTACVFRSTARQTTTRLAQERIEAAALDADMKRARLQLLRAQIEPHFLFNTLANARSLARIDRAAAVEMLNNLMRYFSEALPKLRQDQTALADEMHLIDAYLRIHQTRMGKRLSFELQIPGELLVERVPSMLLLTLVENAIKHGINPSVDGGSIRVSAALTANALVLEVRDSGKGLSSTAGHGTGLANIRRRLTMLYGEAAELSLAPARPRGVIATVSIPRIAA